MKELNKYYLKLTALSPVHIGTGESFEPTNFVIDEGKLFEFNEVLFYKSLNELDKKSFNSKLNDWMQVIDFYKTHIENAKGISDFSTKVTKKVESRYKALQNKDSSKNKNQFEIHKIFKNPNTHRAIIPGSSIKGVLDTVFKIYPPKPSNELRQKLIVSDALSVEGQTEIGYSYRKHKNPSKNAKSAIPQMVEIVKQNSTFILSLKSEKSFDEIKSMMKRYHQERKDSKYHEDKNSFIARIGKFSGKEYMVDNGRNVKNSFGKSIATHTLYEDNNSFGWIKIEEISFNEYQEGLKTISLQEKDYYHDKEKRQGEIKQAIQKAEQEAKQKAIQKQKAKEEEERKRAEKEAKQKAKLASMTPVQRLIEEYSDIAVLINDMKAGKIENFDEIKQELAQEIKKILQQNPKTWDKAKKKALDRRNYIEGLL